MGNENSQFEGIAPTPISPGSVQVFDDKYVVPEEKVYTLYIKEKVFSWSGDTFTVTDVTTGQKVFDVKGKATSLQSKRTVFDATTGKPIFKIKEKVMQLDDKQSIMDPTGTKELFKVSSNVGNTKQYCKFINRKGEAMNLVGKMTFSSSQGAIWVGQAPSKKKPDVQPVRVCVVVVDWSPDRLLTLSCLSLAFCILYC